MNDYQGERRYRVSDRLSNTNTTIFEGKLDKRFFPYFDYLLDSKHSPEESEHFNSIYVKNYALEEQLTKRLASPVSKITAVTGARGVGKSTCMRFFFGVTTQPTLREVPVGEDEDGKLHTEQCLVIPFYLNSTDVKLERVSRILTAQILAAANFLIDQHDVKHTDDVLFDFVHTHKSSLITFPELPPEASPKERMNEFRQSNPYGYVTEVLKFALHKSGIPRLVLIVDDIESCSYEVQKALVKGVFKLRDCLENLGNLTRTFVPSYLFSCRPATFKLLKMDSEIDSFSAGHPIQIRQPARLSDIVEKRFDYAIKMIGEGKTLSHMGKISDVKNLDSWREAYRAFRAVLKKLSAHHELLIVDLCNQDIRQALIDLQATLRNSRWYEIDHHQSGAFTVEEQDFNFASAGLIRALVLREHEFYSDEIGGVVPNLFRNTEDEDFDLMLMHMIMFFFEKTRSNTIVALKKTDLKNALKIAYPKEIVNEHFDDIIDYVRDYEIAREERVKNGNNRSIVYIVPMNKAFRLWRASNASSVFLEFFRDNTFLWHRNVSSFPEARTKGTSKLRDLEKFILCADFVREVAMAEQTILAHVRETGGLRKYKKQFGTRSISRHIYWGLRNSIRRRYPKRDGQATIPRELAKQVSRAGSASSKTIRSKWFTEAGR